VVDRPHSPAWYARLVHELGSYHHPWTRVLDGPDPELTFDALLAEGLHPDTRVLEAGCGHGPDAARFASGCARWAAYDWLPEMLELARNNAPGAEFHLWDGKGEVPAGVRGPFDLIVSRRGPTSVIDHLNVVAAPDARFLYVGPRLDVPRVPGRLAAVGWTVLGEWRVSVRAWTPTWADWQTRCEFMGETATREDWDMHAGARGRAYQEERYVVLAGRA
jgi:SAM-dependent methyltransferase